MPERSRTRSTEVSGTMVTEVEESEVVARSRSERVRPRVCEEVEREMEAMLDVEAKEDDIVDDNVDGRWKMRRLEVDVAKVLVLNKFQRRARDHSTRIALHSSTQTEIRCTAHVLPHSNHSTLPICNPSTMSS